MKIHIDGKIIDLDKVSHITDVYNGREFTVYFAAGGSCRIPELIPAESSEDDVENFNLAWREVIDVWVNGCSDFIKVVSLSGNESCDKIINLVEEGLKKINEAADKGIKDINNTT